MGSFRTSWRVGRVNGVEIRLHVSMLVMVAFLSYAWLPQNRWDWLFLLMLTTGFFIGILLHEVGHALAARWCGLAVTEVVLWPMGEFATWRRSPEKLGHRLSICAAGPLASLLFSLALWAFWMEDLSPVSLWPYLDPVWANLTYQAVSVVVFLNGVLAIVNLLLVEPLDGGGMLTALLERFFTRRVAGTVSLVVGILCVIGLSVLAFAGGGSALSVLWLLLIAGIVAFNPHSRRWMLLGTSVLATRVGLRQLSQRHEEVTPACLPALEQHPRHRSRVLVGWGVLALVILTGLGVLMTRGPAALPVLVLEHANLIDGVSNTPQRDVTVVVAEGRIRAVSPATFSPPVGATRLDLKGRWLLPGLIDAHMHAASIDMSELRDSGMTTGRSMFTAHYMDVALRERHRRGDPDIPEILAAGYPVVPNIGTFPIPDMAAIYGDHPQLKDLRKGADIGVAGVQRLVRANLDRHVDVIKVFATNRAWFLNSDPRGRALSNEQLAAAVAEARKAGVPVAVHAYGDDGVAAAVRAGVSTVEHGVYVADATLALMKARGVCFVPTISAFPQPDPTENRAVDADALAARRQEMAASVRDSSRRARKMGVRVLAGTDGGGSIGDEIVELVAIGMTPMEAIQAATSRSADALGISGRTGSIRQGLEADLIVLDGNPLEDIKAVRKVVLVVNDGRIAANRLPAK
jgi:imidazolonepropionase-like amidohydrolase/Zn-dependent protease